MHQMPTIPVQGGWFGNDFLTLRGWQVTRSSICRQDRDNKTLASQIAERQFATDKSGQTNIPQ